MSFDIIAAFRETVRIEIAPLEARLDAIEGLLRQTAAYLSADSLLDSPALAKKLGISRRALAARLSRDGGGGLAQLSIRDGARWRWRSGDIDRWIADHQRGALHVVGGR